MTANAEIALKHAQAHSSAPTTLRKAPSSPPGPSASKALELVEVMASSATCSLWKGVIRGTGQSVSVKTLKQKQPPKALMTEFEQEANLLQRFSHPNLQRFYGARLRPPRPCIVLEASPIGTLRHVLDTPSKYPLKWKQKLQLALDAATGLAYLHRKGHTHGGIKSHTLLAFESQGRLRLKVAELGLARFRVQLDMTQETDRLHRSLAWEPPEAFSTTVAKQPAGDVYSFGMVLFEVATGRVPFADVGAYGTRQAISNGDIPVISKSLPPAYRELYHACCALKVDARPSMVQVVAALEGLLADGPESVQVTARGGCPPTIDTISTISNAAESTGSLSSLRRLGSLVAFSRASSRAASVTGGGTTPAVCATPGVGGTTPPAMGATAVGGAAAGAQQGRSGKTSPVPALKLKTKHSSKSKHSPPPPVLVAPPPAAAKHASEDEEDDSDASTPSSMLSAASSPLAQDSHSDVQSPQQGGPTGVPPTGTVGNTTSNTTSPAVVEPMHGGKNAKHGGLSTVAASMAVVHPPGVDTPASVSSAKAAARAERKRAGAVTAVGTVGAVTVVPIAAAGRGGASTTPLVTTGVPVPATTAVGAPLPPAPEIAGDAVGASAAIKQLNAKQCHIQVAAATQISTFAKHGNPQRNHMVKAGAVPRLARMLRCHGRACHKAALAALLVLLDGPEGPSDAVGPPRKRGFRALLSLKTACLALSSHTTCSNEAANQLVEADALRHIARVLEACMGAPTSPGSLPTQEPRTGPPSITTTMIHATDPTCLRIALAVLLKLSQYHVLVPQLTQYAVLRTVVNVLHSALVGQECDTLAMSILTQLAEVAPTSISTPAALGMVKALVKRLENPDPTVAGPAAHLLAQIAVTDDVRLAIAKEGPVDVPVLMLGTPQLVLPASELLAAIAGCDYLKQILGTRKAVTTLSSLLPIRIILAADLLNALVVLCTNNTTHQRMLLDAGALPWLLAFAAGSTKPGEDPLGRRGQERGERGTGAAGQERGGGGAAGGQHNNTGGQHNNTAGNNNDNRMTQASNVQANNPQSSNGAATSNGVQGDAGVGVPCDDWPIVRMFAAELLDMVGDAVDPVTGQHYLMQYNGIAWLTKALDAPLSATPQATAAAAAVPIPSSARHATTMGLMSARPTSRTARTARSARPNVTLDEACTCAHTYAALALSKLACATPDCHYLFRSTGTLHSLLSVLTDEARPMEARTAACRALAALAQNNNHVDVIGNSHVLRTLREMLGSRSSLWARRTAAATLAALARRQHVRRPIVENNMVPLLVLLLKDTQAMPHILDALLSLALTPDLLAEVTDSGVTPRLLTIVDRKLEGCAPVALQILQEMCTSPAGRALVAREGGAKVLAKMVHADEPVSVADPALTALSLLAADPHHTPLVNKENVLGRLVDVVARPDWSPRDTSLHALAQLAGLDAAGQYAVVTAGVVPVVMSCLVEGQPPEVRIAAAKVVTAVSSRNKPHQSLLAGRNVLPLLVAMLAASAPMSQVTNNDDDDDDDDEDTITPTTNNVLVDDDAHAATVRMQGAAIRALVALTTGNSEVQEAAREAGAVPPTVELLVSGAPGLRASAALVMANLTFDDVVKQMVAAEAQPGSAGGSGGRQQCC